MLHRRQRKPLSRDHPVATENAVPSKLQAPSSSNTAQQNQFPILWLETRRHETSLQNGRGYRCVDQNQVQNNLEFWSFSGSCLNAFTCKHRRNMLDREIQ